MFLDRTSAELPLPNIITAVQNSLWKTVWITATNALWEMIFYLFSFLCIYISLNSDVVLIYRAVILYTALPLLVFLGIICLPRSHHLCHFSSTLFSITWLLLLTNVVTCFTKSSLCCHVCSNKWFRSNWVVYEHCTLCLGWSISNIGLSQVDGNN